MKHVPHIGLVDPHAKRDGGRDHQIFLRHKPVLPRLNVRSALQPRMIGRGVHPVGHAAYFGALLPSFLRDRTVDNAALPLSPVRHIIQASWCLPTRLSAATFSVMFGRSNLRHKRPVRDLGKQLATLCRLPRGFVGRRRHRRDRDIDGNRSLTILQALHIRGGKAGPHWLMQWASSMANRLIGSCEIAPLTCVRRHQPLRRHIKDAAPRRTSHPVATPPRWPHGPDWNGWLRRPPQSSLDAADTWSCIKATNGRDHNWSVPSIASAGT